MRLFKRLQLALITAAVSVGVPGALSVNVNDGVGVATVTTPQIKALEANVNDGIGVAEDTAAIFDFIAALDDGIGVLDAVSSEVTLEADANDDIGIEDDVTAAATLQIYVDDDVGIVGVVPGGVGNAIVDDDMSVEDVVTTHILNYVSVNDEVGAADAIIAAWSIVGTRVIDSIGIFTDVHYDWDWGVDDGNGIGVEDVVTIVASPDIDVDEGIGVATAAIVQIKILEIAVDDDIGVESADVLNQAHSTVVDDDIGIAGVDTVVVYYGVYTTDGIGTTDSQIPVVDYGVYVSDSLTVADDESQVYEPGINTDDGVSVADVVAAVVDYGINVNDGVGVAEDVTVVSHLGVQVADGVGVNVVTVDWLTVDSTNYDSHCGDSLGHTVEEALDGTDYWQHNVEETHYLILDLGVSYNVTNIRGRSDIGSTDPTDVNIYVSDDKDSFGAAVASGIDFSNTASPNWIEVDVVDKVGRYVKVEIVDTEHVSRYLTFGDSVPAPMTIFDVGITDATVTVVVDYVPNVNDGVGVEDVVTIRPTLEVYVYDDTGLTSVAPVEATLEIYVSNEIGIHDTDFSTVDAGVDTLEVNVEDDVGVTDSVATYLLNNVTVDDDLSIATATTVQIQILEAYVNDGIGVLTNATNVDTVEEAEIGVADYVNVEIAIYEVNVDDDIDVVDWRYYIIPGVEPILTHDIFRYPRLPDDASEEWKTFLLDLESCLRTVLTGDNYVGGVLNADGCKFGDVNNFIKIDDNGVLTLHGRALIPHAKAVYAELSDSTDQTFGSTGTAQSITFNTNDELVDVTHSTSVNPENITIDSTGVYYLIAQPQIHAGAGGAGYFHMWLQKNTGGGFADIVSSNIEITLASNDEKVGVLAETLPLDAGDIIRLRASVGDTKIELDAQTPGGEPAIPSIIFTMFMVGT